MVRQIHILAFFIIGLVIQAETASADIVQDCLKAKGEVKIRACTRVIKSGRWKGKNLAKLYIIRANTFNKLGQTDKALADYGKVLKLDGKSVHVYSGLAYAHYAKGEYNKAEQLYLKSLSVRTKKYGGQHHLVASDLNNLAELLRKKGRFKDALKLHKRALAIRARKLGKNHPVYASNLSNLAVLLSDLEQYSDAEALLKQALTIQEQRLGREHPSVARSLHNLAEIYRELARFGEAESLSNRALEIWKRSFGEKHPEVAKALGNLADLYKAQGLYAKAEPLYKKAIEIHEQVSGKNHPDVAIGLNNLAHLYDAQGRLSESKPLLERAIAIGKRAAEQQSPYLATAINNLASIYGKQGDLLKAETLLKQALLINEKNFGKEHTAVATTLNNLASLYFPQGRYSEAERLFLRALEVQESKLGEDHPLTAATLNNLAGMYGAQGLFRKAEQIYRKALAIKEEALGEDHPDVAASLANLAHNLNIQRRHADATKLHGRALEIRKRVFGAYHPDVADSLNNLAVQFIHQQRYSEAEPLLKNALDIYQKSLNKNHPQLALSFSNMAGVLGKLEHYRTAYKYARRAVNIHSNRVSMSGGRSLTAAIGPAYLGGFIFHTLNEIGWKLGSSEPHRLSELTSDAFAAMQLAGRTSAAAALSQMAARYASDKTRISSPVRQRQDLFFRWLALDKKLITTISAPKDSSVEGLSDRIRADLTKTEQQIVALDARLAREFPEYAELSNPKPLSMAEVIKLLGPDEAMLAYLVTVDHIFLWAITRDGIRWARSDLSEQDIREAVKRLRSGLELTELDQEKLFDLNEAHRLYKELVGPVADLIKDKKHLLIVPSGALTSLPFHLLVTKNPAQAIPGFELYRDAAWLMKTHATTTLPSVSSLRALRIFARKGNAAKPYRGYGDPIFGRDRSERADEKIARAYTSYYRGRVANLKLLSENLPRLADTEQELRAVARSLGAPISEIKLRGKATETAVKKASLKDYRVVHFATHALVAGETQKAGGQEEPALALTLPDKATIADDGLLMASEVAQLKLNADWVVLSACNTAAAGKPGAEALSGLASAFFYAGSRALLVSHWGVQSEAAVKLISKIFEILKQNPNLGRAEALRRSMLALMNDRSSPLNAYPAIWAPFVVIGEGGR